MRFLDGGGIRLERPLHERALSLHVHELLQRLSRQADVAGDLDTIDDIFGPRLTRKTMSSSEPRSTRSADLCLPVAFAEQVRGDPTLGILDEILSRPIPSLGW